MQLDGCLFYFSSRKGLFQPAIYIEIIFNLYSRPLKVLLISDIEQISLRKPLINLQVFLSL
ncbi:hypothetical protein CLI83_08985 [Porphyromonas gingivalis]|nr:hypothetical protein CLI83_08985 [Porphyromonas gingivalis]